MTTSPPIPASTPILMEEDDARSVSFFEFWPGWVMYLPVILQWVLLALRYRSLTLPFLANPHLTLSGMVGVPKSELMKQASGECAQAMLPWRVFLTDNTDATAQAERWVTHAAEGGIHLPFVCKPDIGCRGSGVKKVRDVAQLASIIAAYPKDTSLMCQKLASWEPEVGVFYVKDPATGKGDVVSMTAKFLPRVSGDGIRTLSELIEQDARAGMLRHLYYERHKAAWNTIPEAGESVQLVFSASHSKGAIFRDACADVTPALKQRVIEIMQGLPDFYYGRLDIKYADRESLKKGETLEIIEINAASSESTQIWDRNAKFLDAAKTLLWQYRTLFRIGAYHRKQGKTPPSLATFLAHWRVERNLKKYYPTTD